MSYIEIPVAEYRRRLAAITASQPADDARQAPVRTAPAALRPDDGAV
jgi:hypothetical protein